ncbi:MAG: glycosyl transferase family 4 [Crenarchaeota archaeon]|nr:glycosyl transferase family 4 [Thermoproteota archaeon]
MGAWQPVVIGFLAALATVLIVEPAWIRVARERGLVGRDMNKPGRVLVAEAGGVWAVAATAFGLFFYEAVHVYILGGPYMAVEVYALASLLLLSAFLGFTDDILGWKRGLPRWVRVVFMAPVALPLVVIKAGRSTLSLPLLGTVDLGLLYPLAAVPVGVLGAANAFNMLAGYNGLEAGMGLLLMLSTAAYAYMKGVPLVGDAALIAVGALLGFLRYNWYPARVFPGNVFTYSIGAYYAGLVILGNMERFGLLLFSLYFVKALLYLRGVLHGVWRGGVEDFGVPREDGSLEAPLEGLYSLQHLAIRLQKRLRGRATERGVVVTILSMQAALSAALLLLAWRGLL